MQRPGRSQGFGGLAQGTSVMVIRVETSRGHFPHPSLPLVRGVFMYIWPLFILFILFIEFYLNSYYLSFHIFVHNSYYCNVQFPPQAGLIKFYYVLFRSTRMNPNPGMCNVIKSNSLVATKKGTTKTVWHGIIFSCPGTGFHCGTEERVQVH